MQGPTALAGQAFGAGAHLTCPRCGASASASPGVQTCAGCGGRFCLHLGAAADPAVAPPMPVAHAPLVKVRSAGLVTHRFGVIEPLGVAEGELDPVVAMMTTDKAGVAWPDVLSISIWRKPDWIELVVVTLIPLPLALLALVGSFTVGPGLFFISLPLSALVAWMLYRSIAIQRTFARVCGRHRTITIRFDRPVRRRALFHRELLRRAGLPDAPMP